MKIFRHSALLIALLLLLATVSSTAQEERITDFEVEVVVKKDRSISVTEWITVVATGRAIKRGITRNFPTHRRMNGRSVGMKYDIVNIQKNNKDEPYFTRSSDHGFTIYIGQKEVFLEPGQYTYRIQYEVPNQIGFFDKYDEIYWNAIGTDVDFKVEKASCRVLLPANASVVQQTAYVGYRGQSKKDYTMDSEQGMLTYQTMRSLQPREGFTVGVGFQKGLVEAPGLLERYGTLLLILFGLALLLGYYVYTWMLYGKDPPTPASYPLYETPDGLSPASISYLSKEGYQTRSFAASVIHMAIRGYLKIEERSEKGIFSSSRVFDLVRLKRSDEGLPREEQRLFNTLFVDRDRVTIDGSYQPRVEKTYLAHRANLGKQHRAFVREGHNSRFLLLPFIGSFIVGGLAVFLFASNPYAEGINFPAILAFVLVALASLGLYFYLIKKPTVEKLDLKSRIKGFRMYLEMAEKDRLNLLNPPDMTPQHFEEVLPYAFALGVEHSWSDTFKTILEQAQYQPEWNNHADPIHFSRHFGRGFSGNLKGSATQPQSSSSGGGSGGGGFSGGGGGGGGVGGW